MNDPIIARVRFADGASGLYSETSTVASILDDDGEAVPAFGTFHQRTERTYR